MTIKYFATIERDTITIENSTIKMSEVSMSHRVCDSCGHNKDTSGGKSCSKGHFICHSCARSHVHCPLCGHTLR